MPSPSNLANDDMTLPAIAAAFPPIIVSATPITVPGDEDDDEDDEVDSTPVYVPRTASNDA